MRNKEDIKGCTAIRPFCERADWPSDYEILLDIGTNSYAIYPTNVGGKSSVLVNNVTQGKVNRRISSNHLRQMITILFKEEEQKNVRFERGPKGLATIGDGFNG